MRELVILCVWMIMGIQAVHSSGSGCFTVQPSMTPASSCDSSGVFLQSCLCDKYLDELTMMFTGQSGSDVFVYEDKNHHKQLASFANVQHGDLLIIADGGRHLKKTLYFSVSGSPDVEIDTDCKKGHHSLPGIEIGQVYGDFIIEGYVDDKGNVCSMTSSSGTCICEKYLAQITMIYTGNSGVNVSIYEDKNLHKLLESYSNVQRGDMLVIDNHGKKLKKKIYFVIGGMPPVEVATDCKGSHYSIPFAVGNTYGDFTAAGFIDVKGNRCGITSQCMGDGAVTLNITGGDAPFTFEWSDGGSAQGLSGLCTGYYYFTVTDANGCSVEDSVFVDCSQVVANSIAVTGSVVNVPCSGTYFGRIELQVSGGVPPYHYNWSNGEVTFAIIDLHPGVYSVTVSDSRGSSDTESFTVKAASCGSGERCFSSPIIPNLVNATSSWIIDDNAQTVTIRTTFSKTFVDNTYGVNAVGWKNGHTFNMLVGSDHLQLVLYDVSGTRKMEFKTDYISASSLAPSGYKSLGVTGGDGRMIFGNATDVVGAHSSLAENFNTFGYVLTSNSPASDTSYSSNLAYPDWIYEVWYEVTINLSAFGTEGFGYPDIVFVHASPSKTGQNSEPVEFPCPGCRLSVSGSSSPVTMCNSSYECDGSISVNVSGGGPPYSFIWSTGDTTHNLSGLCSGMYYVTVSDFGQCVVKDSFFVSCADSCDMSVHADAMNVSCFGGGDGKILVSVSNGEAPFSYLWSSGETSDEIAGLSAGEASFAVTVNDAVGCSVSIEQDLLIDEPAPLVVQSTVTDASCFGANDGSAFSTAFGGTAPYQYEWSNGQISYLCLGFVAGTYYVTATDVHGCMAADTVLVGQPGKLTLGAVTVPPSCFNSSNGSVDLSVTGGTAPFEYAWSTGENSQDIQQVSAGTYNVSVDDGNGCSATLAITIQYPMPIMIASFVDSVSCSGDDDGNVHVTVTGGISPYAYEWSNGFFSEDLIGIPAGQYSLTVTDDEGCVVSESFSVQEPIQLSAVVNFSNEVGCVGGNDGVLCAQASGGVAPYSYQWSSGATAACASGLSAGTYHLTVIDKNACSVMENVQMNEPSIPFAATIEIVSPVSCDEISDAHLCAQLIGGEAPYSFEWSSGEVTACIQQLGAGNYKFTATDNNGCVAVSNSVMLTEPLPLSISTIADNANCFGASDGGAGLEVSGGTIPYSYAWSNGASSQDLQGVPAGNYSVTVTDSHGCSSVVSTTVGEPGPMVLGAVTAPVSCSEGNDGAINLSIQGGVQPYIFSWSNAETSEDISDLQAGEYSVTVEDLNGCIATLSVTVLEPQPMVLTSEIINASGTGQADGSIDITVTGGTAPYAYQWSTGSSTEDLSGLAEGLYMVTVTDANGCAINDNFNLGVNLRVIGELFNIEARPNPSTTLFFIDFYSNTNGTARLDVIDNFDRKILSKSIEMKTGKSTAQIELSDIPAGIYYVIVYMNDEMKVQRIEKVY